MTKLNLKIQIPSTVLKTLRESSGFSIEDIAKKLKTSVERITAIEQGAVSFTMTQIKKLADIYRRPLAAFFEETAPEPPYKLTDFRVNRNKKLTPQVFLAERRAFYLSSKLAELSGEKSAIPAIRESLKPDELAEEFRKYLKAELFKNEKPGKILNYYKKLLEENLSIAVIEYPLKADDVRARTHAAGHGRKKEKDDDVRAFCIPSDISIIVLNESDDARIKLFSLFHEVCHLLKRNSGICSMELEIKENNQNMEFDCNQFSAEFLVPQDDFKLEAKKFDTNQWDGISSLSDIYGVSKQVIMLRLLNLNLINQQHYAGLKSNWAQETLEKRGFGKRNWEHVYQNRVGSLAIKQVNNAYRKGDISYSEVIDILNLKTKYIEKLVK